MPEAAVYEHRDLSRGEHDVWSNCQGSYANQEVLAEAQTSAMQTRSELYFGFGVGLAVRSHDSRSGGRCREGVLRSSHTVSLVQRRFDRFGDLLGKQRWDRVAKLCLR